MSKIKPKTFRWDRRDPCKSCPYRKDAVLEFWSPKEFEQLLASEQSFMGAIYACHGTKSDPDVCAGWLLDQKKRGLPSIALRVAANDPREGDAVIAAINSVHSGGHKMFRTIQAMCRANGVREKAK